MVRPLVTRPLLSTSRRIRTTMTILPCKPCWPTNISASLLAVLSHRVLVTRKTLLTRPIVLLMTRRKQLTMQILLRERLRHLLIMPKNQQIQQIREPRMQPVLQKKLMIRPLQHRKRPMKPTTKLPHLTICLRLSAARQRLMVD